MDIPDKVPDFSGKVLWLEIAGAPQERGGVLLEYVEFQKLAGRLFLVGRMAEWDVSGWLAGANAAVAWEAVLHYLVFASREEYQQRASTLKPPFRERLFGK